MLEILEIIKSNSFTVEKPWNPEESSYLLKVIIKSQVGATLERPWLSGSPRGLSPQYPSHAWKQCDNPTPQHYLLPSTPPALPNTPRDSPTPPANFNFRPDLLEDLLWKELYIHVQCHVNGAVIISFKTLAELHISLVNNRYPITSYYVLPSR